MSNQELNNHKKSDAAKWWLTLVGFILTGVILVGMMFGIITPVQNVGKNPTTAEQTETSEVYEGFTTRFVNTQNVMLSAEKPVTYAANGAYVEQTLTATVMPSNATNKKVDWTVAWADGQTGTVTDYVTVTPASDGSTTASVKCYQAFTGNIIITVTTRESGFEASCIVTFKGIPSDIAVSGDIGQSDDGFYYLGVGATYTYDVALSNIFDSVGDEFYDNMDAELELYGTVILANRVGGTFDTTTCHEVTLDSLTGINSNFISISYSDGVLSITMNKTIESYQRGKSIQNGSVVFLDHFYAYGANGAYFKVILSVPGTSVSKTLKIKYDGNVVTGVDISSSEITF